jgi:hypothetical protein
VGSVWETRKGTMRRHMGMFEHAVAQLSCSRTAKGPLSNAPAADLRNPRLLQKTLKGMATQMLYHEDLMSVKEGRGVGCTRVRVALRKSACVIQVCMWLLQIPAKNPPQNMLPGCVEPYDTSTQCVGWRPGGQREITEGEGGYAGPSHTKCAVTRH